MVVMSIYVTWLGKRKQSMPPFPCGMDLADQTRRPNACHDMFKVIVCV